MSENLSEEADILTQKEDVAQDVARIVARSFGIESDVAVSGSRWAVLWMDDFMKLVDEISPQSPEDYTLLARRSRQTSMDRYEGEKTTEVRLAAAYSFGIFIRHPTVLELVAMLDEPDN